MYNQIFGISQRSQLYFSRVQKSAYIVYKSKYNASNSNLSLNKDPNNIFMSMPQNFTITTKNGSSKFNRDFLIETSTTISNFVKEIHNDLKYHLDIEDPRNVLGKFEKLYQGQKVIFEEEDLQTSHEITEKLFIVCCPNYMKPISLKCPERGPGYLGNQNDLQNGVEMNGLNNYLRKPDFQTFSIVTKRNKYKCNIYGVYLSKVIRDQLEKDPLNKVYNYDIEDEYKEFSIVCDLFNFNVVEMNKNNMDSLKEIAEDLQIECILNDIDKYINDSEKVTQTIDDQLEFIDSIDELFHWLHNINDITVDSVKNSIMQSFWIETVENVQELAAFIIEVAKSNILLHSYLVDLLIQLNEQANESNCLEILTPFIVSKLMDNSMPSKTNEHSFDSYSLSHVNQNMKCSVIYSFIYKLYRKGIIQKEDIIQSLKVYKFDDSVINLWFLPLLIEMDKKNIDLILPSNNNNSNDFCSDENRYLTFIKTYLPDKIDLYEKMLDSGEPDDILTKALRHDDVDTFQSIISRSQINVKTSFIPFNIYDLALNPKMKYINYAAEFGSLKCFKYLLLNHDSVDDKTFQYAIYGGNNEIIKIVDQKKTGLFKKKSINTICNSIIKHKNDLYDWLFANDNDDYYKKSYNQLALLSAEHGNAHVLADIIDRGYDIQSKYQDLIQKTSRNGFYRLTKFLFTVIKEKVNIINTDFKSFPNCSNPNIWINSVYYGNISFFKLFYKNLNQKELESAICFATEKKYINIVDFFFEELSKGEIQFVSTSIMRILSTSLMDKDIKLFNYLLEKIMNINKDIIFSLGFYSILLRDACRYKNFEGVKYITEIILNKNPNENFSQAFAEAASNGSIELCQYFIDKKVIIEYDELTLKCDEFGLLNKSIFSLIISKINPKLKNNFLICIKQAINNKNKELVEYLFKEGAQCKSALILAVNTNDLDMVNTVLNFNSKPYFINKILCDRSALHDAIQNDNLPIVKRLLEIPGINPGLYNQNFGYPIITAINKRNLDIINAILDFYGDNIQYQKQQLIKIFNEIYELYNRKVYKHDPKVLQIVNRILEIKFIDPNIMFPYPDQKNSLSDEENYDNNNNDDDVDNVDIENEKNKQEEINDEKEEFDDYLTYIDAFYNLESDDDTDDDFSIGSKDTLLLCACNYKDVDMVNRLLSLDKIDVNLYSTLNGDTPLIIAVKKKYLSIAKLLIENPKTNINQRNFYEKTPLTIAVNNNLYSIVDLLITNERFDPEESRFNHAFNISNWKISKKLITSGFLDLNNPKCLVLEKSVKNNDIEILDFIINHSTIDKNNANIEKALIVSIMKNNFDIFQKLLKLIDDDINFCDFNGQSLLSHSISYSNEKVFNFILTNDKFDSKKSKILETFVSSYSNMNKLTKNITNIMTILYNYDKDHDHLIDFTQLLPQGKSFFTVIVAQNDGLGNVSDFLIEHGVDPNKPDKNGIYPLEKAIEINSFEIVHSLINSNKIDFSIKILRKNIMSNYAFIENKNYYVESGFTTYLHLAARSPNEKILNEFLEKDLIDINITDDLGNTPLMDSCLSKRVRSIKLLFQKDNLDYLHVNNDGKDALCLVSEFNEKINQLETKRDYYKELKRKVKKHINSEWGRNYL